MNYELYKEIFEERAAILEYEGKMPRVIAEKMAKDMALKYLKSLGNLKANDYKN